jgi:Domain of unknown function (DUF1877)
MMSMNQYLRSVTIEEFEAICQYPRDEVSALLWNQEEFLGDYLELGGIWAGLLFLLTGKGLGDLDVGKSPLGWVTLGNHSVGGDDNPIPCSWMGIRYLLPDEVQQVSDALSQVSHEALVANYAPKIMDEQDVHPMAWEEWGDDCLDWLLQCYAGVVSFYEQAAAEGKVMIMYMPF